MSSRLEDYKEVRVVGRGTFGTCKKILRKADNKVLAWKELDYGHLPESERQKLTSEVNLLRELRHPNIVRYYDRIYDRAKGRLYLVMEYCEGGDLAHLIEKHAKQSRYLEEDFILRVFAQLTSALKDCHRRYFGGHTVLHRDVKPANIFLDAKQNVKLGDFGLARILHHDYSFAKTFVGTPFYMSPEQMSSELYNEKSDIWSLGVVVYELSALTRPFSASNFVALAEQIKAGRFSPIPNRFSSELHRVIGKMLNLKASERPSVHDLRQNPLLARWTSTERTVSTETKPKCAVHGRGPCPSTDTSSRRTSMTITRVSEPVKYVPKKHVHEVPRLQPQLKCTPVKKTCCCGTPKGCTRSPRVESHDFVPASVGIGDFPQGEMCGYHLRLGSELKCIPVKKPCCCGSPKCVTRSPRIDRVK